MSWLSENYEKAAIGLAGVAIIGVGALVFLNLNTVSEDFEKNKVKGGDASGTPNAWKITEITKSVTNPLSVVHPDFNGRSVDSFVGIPLFVQKDALDKAIDLENSESVHSPIPNTWWLEHRLDPGFSDSPDRDPDGDGFSNLEEFEAKTNPRKASDFPALLDKLAVTGVEDKLWRLEFRGEIDGAVNLSLRLSKGRPHRTDYKKPGHVFPSEGNLADGPFKDAFKFKELKQIKENNPRAGVEETSLVAIVEDQRPNKKGTLYRVRQRDAPNKKERRHFLGHDYTAVFVLNAVGQEGEEFRVQEGESFSLPFGEGPKVYKIKMINAQGVVIVENLNDGAAPKTVELKSPQKPAQP